MLAWIIQITIISIILIFLVHHLIEFFKSTLTVPKIKDLVNIPTKKYENIYNIINQHDNTPIYNNANANSNNDYTLIDLLPNQDTTNNTTNANNISHNMKNELKDFLKSQLHS